jgi:hypothetical protein
MGPPAAKSFPGTPLIDVTKRPAERAKQEIDYGRRGKGEVCGAFQPATGDVFTGTAQRRTTASFVAFLDETENWIDPTIERVDAMLDNLSAHRATDVLLVVLAHPRSRG